MEADRYPGPAGEAAAKAGLVLTLEPEGLTLSDGTLSLRGDYSRLQRRLQGPALNRELLVRAARGRDSGKRLTAVDCTAGLGEDALLLAAAGFDVTLFEYNPVIYALLEDTIRRALCSTELGEAAGRMHPVREDAVSGLSRLGFRPDVIYLDPMFPAKTKNAATRKKLQLFRKLETPCREEEDLLSAAIGAGPGKIIIKRPVKGPWLAGRKPSYSIEGRTVRYDCLVLSGA